MNTILLLAQAIQVQKLSGTGIVLMIACVGFVLALTGFCFRRLTRPTNPADKQD